MNLTRFMPNLLGPSLGEDSAEFEAAEARKARIQFHRDHVRNGPVKFNDPSQGRLKSGMRRHLVAKSRKDNVRHRRDWLRARHDIARLRGQLETVAAIKTSAGVYMTGQPVALMRNAMRGLYDGYADTLGVEVLDFNNLDHRDLVVSAAVHHYRLAMGAQR